MKINMRRIDIDVSGENLFSKNYTICIVVDNKFVFAYRFPKQIQDRLRENHRKGNYGLKSSAHLQVRTYAVVLAELLNTAKIKCNIRGDYKINLCNDFDYHFQDIKNVLSSKCALDNIEESTVLARHEPNSVVQLKAKLIREGNTRGSKLVPIPFATIEKHLMKKKRK